MHRTRRFRWPNLFVGLEMVVAGFFLKLVVADNLSPFVTINFALPEAYNSLSLLLSVVLFAFQIYGDFAGYSLIAIGVARVMGYSFPANFRRPYFAASFSEFWTRWHISLSSWLRDYLYVSLGGNRRGTARTYRNLMTTMLLGGLWHGANWTFIGWGALHGLYLVAQRVLGAAGRRLPVAIRLPATLVRPIQVVAVFALVCVAWVFFRADSFAEALAILERILFLGDWRFADLPGKFLLVKGLALVALLVAFELAAEQRRLRLAYGRLRWARTAGILVLLWLIPLAASFSGERFIYFQF
jgi:D-alanyl-lipoteichoic acid acyltransferase DltB (MBOAT superfamily)